MAGQWKKDSSDYLGRVEGSDLLTGPLRLLRLFRSGTRSSHDQMISYKDIYKEEFRSRPSAIPECPYQMFVQLQFYPR
ncbi:hypothetical protein J2S67_000635 [Pseudoglutamicibacter albus]|uniref:Uncharacterized protein n=1 Tax=Pseudoglutamicibacter albus TaxID=98671 RepID=A0ABU1YYD2_9MICC|nr:hypothetical protein [Pseudoglutamicibacter albus]